MIENLLYSKYLYKPIRAKEKPSDMTDDEKKMGISKITLTKRLVNLKYKDRSSIVEHTSEFQCLMNKSVTMKIRIDEELLLLNSLPDSWETLVVIVTNSTPNGIVTMDMLKIACSMKKPKERNR